MKYTFGFIGAGNMGGALAKAASKGMDPAQIALSDKDTARAESLAAELGCTAASVRDVAASCQYVFFGVKPQMMGALFEEIGPVLAARNDEFVLVSMMAGVLIGDIRKALGADYPVIRIMPNIPAAVGGGVILFDATENVSEAAVERFCTNMRCAGLVDRLPEHLIDAGTAISGCGPAYVCLFIEAMADGGVACGLPRDKAVRYAAQMLMGTAKLLLENGQHPGQLKDAVCSPGGSTIAGVRALEQNGFRAAAMDAVESAYLRTQELGKK